MVQPIQYRRVDGKNASGGKSKPAQSLLSARMDQLGSQLKRKPTLAVCENWQFYFCGCDVLAGFDATRYCPSSEFTGSRSSVIVVAVPTV
jgi:hypothetical protein